MATDHDLLQLLPLAVARLGADGGVVQANPAAAALVGRPGEDLTGTRLHELGTLADTDTDTDTGIGTGDDLLRAAREGRTQHLDLAVRRHDGVVLDLRVTVVPVPGEGPDTGALVVAEDVTEQHRLARELDRARAVALEAAAARADLVARTSHEVRTPLTSILAVTELLADADDHAEQQQLTETLRRSGRRLLRLVDNLLHFGSGLDAVDENVHEEFDLHDLIRDAVALVEAPARHRGVVVGLQVDDAVPRVVRDHPTWTSQILGNLLSNAVAHTEAGRIDLAVTRVDSSASGTCVMYRVSDTGSGIAPEQAERVFEPFQRAQGEDQRAPAGVGLGLSIVKQLVQLSGGTVALTSTPGVGSTFTVVLPVRAPLA